MSHCNVMSETLKNTPYNTIMSNKSYKMTPHSCIHDHFISKLLLVSSVPIQAVISFMQKCQVADSVEYIFATFTNIGWKLYHL